MELLNFHLGFALLPLSCFRASNHNSPHSRSLARASPVQAPIVLLCIFYLVTQVTQRYEKGWGVDGTADLLNISVSVSLFGLLLKEFFAIFYLRRFFFAKDEKPGFYGGRPPYFSNKIILDILERETKILNYLSHLSTNCWRGIGLHIFRVVQDDQRLVASIYSVPGCGCSYSVSQVKSS